MKWAKAIKKLSSHNIPATLRNSPANNRLEIIGGATLKRGRIDYFKHPFHIIKTETGKYIVNIAGPGQLSESFCDNLNSVIDFIIAHYTEDK